MNNEQRLTAIFDTLPIGAAVITPDLEILDINQQFKKFIKEINSKSDIPKNFNDEILLNNNLLLSVIKLQAISVIETSIAIEDVEIHLMNNEKKSIWFSVSVSPFCSDLNCVIAIVSEISYKKQIEQDIKNTNNQLRKVSDYIEFVREEERKKIALWIHDDIGQVFTGLKMDLTSLEMKLDQLIDQDAKKRFDTMQRELDGSIIRIREIAYNLRPPFLDHFGICNALEFQLNDLSERSGFKVFVNKNVKEIELTDERKTTLFRLMQELFINIIRHSKATEVELDIKKDGTDLFIYLHDNGIGISKSTLNSPKSFGLMAIKERIRALKGTINYLLNEGEGTKINIKVPI